MDSRLFGRTWASFFHEDSGVAALAGEASIVFEGESDIVGRGKLLRRYYIRQMFRYI